jgi:hypothetical protein
MSDLINQLAGSSWRARARGQSRVLALIADLDIRIINRDTGELLRARTLNPPKDYQPQAGKQNDVRGHL